MRTFGWVFFGLGVLFLGIAIIIWAWGAAFRIGAVEVTGRVSEVILSPRSDGNVYCPAVRYTTRSGQTFTHYSNICSWPAAYEVGQEVRMFYDASDPERAQMDDFFGTWFLPLLFGFLGLVFGGVGYFTLFPVTWFTRFRS